jgi:2-C-methyl-D-erythritol 4-phosphate cytidylyltransferase/2-C-methyl-D-erythritol 2,4-cyclodiphosphate synthase
MTTAALIVAAGRGSRIGGSRPKQYESAGGAALLGHAVSAFTAHEAVSATRVVIHGDDRALYEEAVAGLEGLGEPVIGGASRQESVRIGLEALAPAAPDRVLIHDGARPFVDAGTISRVLAALDGHDGAIAAIPVTDTIKRAEGDRIAATVERDGLWAAQTPQGFRFAPILTAHRQAAAQGMSGFTDDAAVAQWAGLDVAVVPGEIANRKVTTPGDLAEARRLFEGAAPPLLPRIGHGFDVHAFEPGDHVMLCGVRIGHDRGLKGHSDADVGLHALTDAIYGALCEGDIGVHFPPGDRRWKNAGSDMFLAAAAARVAARGGHIAHVDVTLVCEAPRIGPHSPSMRSRIADILGVTIGRVSVKATTTEGLGYTGRREGIAAYATATVLLPDQDQ